MRESAGGEMEMGGGGGGLCVTQVCRYVQVCGRDQVVVSSPGGQYIR